MPAETAKSANTEDYLRGRGTTPRSGRATTPTFGINPAPVLLDRKLSFRAKCIYAVMAYFREGAYVNVGERRIAGAAGVDRRSLRNDIAKLIEREHLKRVDPEPRERARYLLVDMPAVLEMLASKKQEAREIQDARDAFKRPLATCPKCKQSCGGLLKVGWCRRCNRKVELRDEMRQVVREEIAAVRIA